MLFVVIKTIYISSKYSIAHTQEQGLKSDDKKRSKDSTKLDNFVISNSKEYRVMRILPHEIDPKTKA